MSKRIITIGRECGSGGHTIGKRVAERLGIAFYDKEIVELVAAKTKLSPDFIDAHGEYFRSVEGGEEQNYSFIDGNKNNCKKKTGRASVLKKLRQKQAEIEKRGRKPVPQMEAADMERRRKQMMER